VDGLRLQLNNVSGSDAYTWFGMLGPTSACMWVLKRSCISTPDGWFFLNPCYPYLPVQRNVARKGCSRFRPSTWAVTIAGTRKLIVGGSVPGAGNAITNLPEKVGVTATLALNYRAPTRADQFIVLKTRLVELKGRKATVTGRVEDLEGTLLVDADALFIQPRYAKLLDPKLIRQNLGEPTKTPVLIGDGVKLPK